MNLSGTSDFIKMIRFLAVAIVVACGSQVLGLFMAQKCCTCGQYINITLIAENILQEPHFNISVEISSPQRELIYLLQEAVDIDERFRFTATYWNGKLGHYITSINKVAEDVPAHKYWEITDQRGYSPGVSSHIPNHGDVILLNFTAY